MCFALQRVCRTLKNYYLNKKLRQILDEVLDVRSPLILHDFEGFSDQYWSTRILEGCDHDKAFGRLQAKCTVAENLQRSGEDEEEWCMVEK